MAESARKHRFSSPEEAAAFYGAARRAFYQWKKLGEDARDPLPYGNPEEMPAWFARMRAAGLRKHKCPAAVEARAREVLAQAPGSGTPLFDPPSSPAVPAPASAPAASAAEFGEPLLLTGASEAGVDDILSINQRTYGALAARYTRQMEAGDFTAARNTRAEMDEIGETIRKWMRDQKSIRAGSDAFLPVLPAKNTISAALSRLWRALQRESLRSAPADQREALDAHFEALAARLPAILEEEFDTALAAAA